MTNNEWTIKLSDFEGPLDLLLHLIKQSKMTIFELDLAEITGQYLAFIKHQQDMQLDVASEYLLMAANLLKIKSKDLLPVVDDEIDELLVDEVDEKAALVQQLMLYEQVKQATEILEKQQDHDQISFVRPALVDERQVNQFLEPGLALIDLQAAFNKLVLKQLANRPVKRQVQKENYTLSMAFDNLYQKIDQITDKSYIAFHDVVDNLTTKEPLIMNFLAILEAAKSQKIQLLLDQNDQIMIQKM